MPLPEDLVLYYAANAPDDDTSTVGGAIDTAARPLDAELAGPPQDLEAVSDGTDTRNITVIWRDTTGVIQTNTVALTSTTPVTVATGVERVLEASLATPDATNTVTLRIAAAGATQHTFNPNETLALRAFRRSFSDPDSPLNWFEKQFWSNDDGALALTEAEVTLTADPSAVILIALDNAKDAATTATDRLTAPAAGVGAFVDDGIAIGVPDTFLGPAEAIGTWIQMQLATGNPALRSSYTLQISGQSTGS